MLATCVLLVAWRLSLAAWPQVAEHIERHTEGQTLVILTQESRREVRHFDGMFVVAGRCCSQRTLRMFDSVWLVAGGPVPRGLIRALSNHDSTEQRFGELDVLHFTRPRPDGSAP